jgi:hypothetical protein
MYHGDQLSPVDLRKHQSGEFSPCPVVTDGDEELRATG